MTGHQPQPASDELLALAAKVRPDWDQHSLWDALARARTQGMTWGHFLVAAVQLMADPDGEPADLIPAAPEAWRQQQRPQPPETAHRGAAAARAALHQHDTTYHH